MGFNEVPPAGLLFEVVETEREARDLVSERFKASKQQTTSQKMTLEDLFAKVQTGME